MRARIIGLIVLLSLFKVSAVWATTHYVPKSINSTQLSDFIYNTASGDTLFLAFEGQMIFDQTVVISKTITIQGIHTQDVYLTGDAVTLFEVAVGATLSISDVSFAETVSSAQGLIKITGGRLKLVDCHIHDNILNGNEGMVYIESGTADIWNCTFSGNSTAGQGVAVLNDGAQANLTQCTFFNNLSQGTAGGVVTTMNGGKTHLLHCTLAYNNWENDGMTAADADSATGGIAAGPMDSVYFTRNIVFGNTKTIAGAANPSNTTSKGSLKLRVYLRGNNIFGASNLDPVNIGTTGSIINADPLVDNQLTYGFGKTPVLLLGKSSPAIDATLAIAMNTDFAIQDQRGYPRRLDSDDADNIAQMDYGAVEMPSRYVTQLGDAGAGSLREALTAAMASSNSEVIAFNLSNSGDLTINLTGPLPKIEKQVYIDGYLMGVSPADRISINGGFTSEVGFWVDQGGDESIIKGVQLDAFKTCGVLLDTTVTKCIVQSSNFGVQTDVSSAVDSMGAGIVIAGAGHSIGGASATGNFITNCKNGILLDGTMATQNVVMGNVLGGDVNGSWVNGNYFGVFITNGANRNRIGQFQSVASNQFVFSEHTNIFLNEGANNNLVQGNQIGVSNEVANAEAANAIGISIANGANANVIGNTTNTPNYDALGNRLACGNLIYNVKIGVGLSGAGTSFNRVSGNTIGQKADGTATTIEFGIALVDGASENQIGGFEWIYGNDINGNATHGIYLLGDATISNPLITNRISNYSGSAIKLGQVAITNDTLDLDQGPNQLQNQPTISGITKCNNVFSVNGYLSSKPNTKYRLDFYKSNDAGFTTDHIGSTEVTTGAFGFVFIGSGYSTDQLTAGDMVRVTATDMTLWNTSELSAPVVVKTTTANLPVVTVSGDLDFSICAGDTIARSIQISNGTGPYLIAYSLDWELKWKTALFAGTHEVEAAPSESVNMQLRMISDINGCLNQINDIGATVKVSEPWAYDDTLFHCPSFETVVLQPDSVTQEIDWYDDKELTALMHTGFSYEVALLEMDPNGDNAYYTNAGQDGCKQRVVKYSIMTSTALCDSLELGFYKAFSPNGDGLNDTWIIDGVEEYPENTLVIVDEWGNPVREYTGYNNLQPWDGKDESGNEMPFGTYYYLFRAAPELNLIRGWIQLTP